jgi:hypothetical protein
VRRSAASGEVVRRGGGGATSATGGQWAGVQGEGAHAEEDDTGSCGGGRRSGKIMRGGRRPEELV